MTDSIENILLEHVTAIRAGMRRDMAILHGDIAIMHKRLDHHEERLERIERRLELAA